EEGECGVRRFLREVVGQWRSLSVEVRSVRSMLEEVLSNWERYGSTVASLQAWLEDAEAALSQPENTKREFFRNLQLMMEQHAAMNDAGNFLIETCDESVSLGLKQQLLLLNGRWRDLFLHVKHYAHAEELEAWRRDHLKAMSALRELLDSAEGKLNAPVPLAFSPVRSFLQDVENTKQKVVSMETQYKLASRSAQLLAKDAPPDEGARVMAAMATAKGQLSKVRERCAPLVRECHGLLPLLEEMENYTAAFHLSLERAGLLTATARAPDSLSQNKPVLQDLLTEQQSCKRSLSVIERNFHALQRALSTSKVLHNVDQTLLQKRTAEIQASAQALVLEVGEWRRQDGAGGCLRRRFEESRLELERVLGTAQDCLAEPGAPGDPEEVLRRHNDFFSQLDQRVLSVFLKACDELTDILPEAEQQELQETVRRLHKHWKDVQGEVPSHLVRLKVEVEQRRVALVLQDCRLELSREMEALSGTCTSERVIKEHRAYFAERKPLASCEKWLRIMEELCQQVPDNDPAHRSLGAAAGDLAAVTDEIEKTRLKLLQHPDKWREWNDRFCELSDWLSSQRRQVRSLRETAGDGSPTRQEQVDAALQALQEAVDEREETLCWLKRRLAALSEVSPELEVQRERAALATLSTDLRALLSSLCQWDEQGGSSMFQSEELREEVRGALEEVHRVRREAQEHYGRVLEAETLGEARQLYLIHQQHLKRLHAGRKEADILVAHCRQLQKEEGLSRSLGELEEAFGEGDLKSDAQGHNLQTALRAWQEFESERESIWKFLTSTNAGLAKELLFNSQHSLKTELDLSKELFSRGEEWTTRAKSLLETAPGVHLGAKNQRLLLEQARSTMGALAQLQEHLRKNINQLELVHTWWEHSGSQSEAFFLWISEKERELEDISSASSPDSLDKQLSSVEAVEAALEEKRAWLVQLEGQSQALSGYVTPGEAGRIRARLGQMGRGLEELRGRVQQLIGQLQQSASHRQRYSDNLEQVKKSMSDLEEKLDLPMTFCSSSSETYRGLQEHMELCQAVEQLTPRLTALCSALKRLGDGGPLEEEVARLQDRQREDVERAKEKQAALEDLLALWQRFEKESSSIRSWLDRCEMICCPDIHHLSADKVKLRNELQNIQEMQSEAPANETALEGLLSLRLSLTPTAPEECVRDITDDITRLQERCSSLKDSVTHRLELLETHLSQLEVFDKHLVTLAQWSDNFLSGLRSSSLVDMEDLEAAVRQLQEQETGLLEPAPLQETLHGVESSLLPSSTPEARQQLQGWREECLQPLGEAQRLLRLRGACLAELGPFLRRHAEARRAVQHLREALEGRGSWDRSKAEQLHAGVGAAARDLAALEAEALGLDGRLSKAHLHLVGAEAEAEPAQGATKGPASQGRRTSCRGQTVGLLTGLEGVQRTLGWRQSEAEALGALWSSFRERKEEVMAGLARLEEAARKEDARESSVQAFQNRLRTFVQMEDELQCLQHSRDWLGERGSQLAQRDSELAGDALREVGLVEAAWTSVTALITHGQEQSGAVIQLLRQFHALRSSLGVALENAQAVTHSLPDHNHSREEVRRILVRHEAAQAELRDRQESMDLLISTEEDLQREMEKTPGPDTHSIQTDMETLRDQWLEVSERLQTNGERLGYCVALWDDLKATEQDVGQWASAAIVDLTDSVANLSDGQKAEARLATFQTEAEIREQRLDALQDRVLELKDRARLQQTPVQMQVLESDLRKKMAHAHEVYNQAKHALTYFSFQRQRLEDLASQMTARLEAVEGSLAGLSEDSSPDHMDTVKGAVQRQRADLDNGPPESSDGTVPVPPVPPELVPALGRAQPPSAKGTEAAALRCNRTWGGLQAGLQLHFNDLVQEFQSWLAELQLELRDCSSQSGDGAALKAKIYRLKVSLEQAGEGQRRLGQVCQEAERLVQHLPRAGAAQVQEHLAACQRAWSDYELGCSRSGRELEQSRELLHRFEERVAGIKGWLEQLEVSLKKEPVLGPDGQQGALDSAEELERMETPDSPLLTLSGFREGWCEAQSSQRHAGALDQRPRWPPAEGNHQACCGQHGGPDRGAAGKPEPSGDPAGRSGPGWSRSRRGWRDGRTATMGTKEQLSISWRQCRSDSTSEL
ncbi:unnamed protein product, partial [Boreogadus saida]